LVALCQFVNLAGPAALALAACRQTLLFSATMPRKVERLAADALTSPVRVTVGEVGAANEDIKQVGPTCLSLRGNVCVCAGCVLGA
jgi:hypothetical protein